MKKLIGSLSLLTLGIVSMPALAGVHFDSHGNVGYDTLAECQTAINSGSAKFYKSSTTHKPLLRNREVAVKKGILGNLAPEYSKGTCDIGTGRRGGRDGVASAIQGKYIPYSPNMMINQYVDASGDIIRVSMSQCDNWFSGAFPQRMPKPVYQAPQPVPKPVYQAPQPVPKPMPVPEVVVITPTPPAPVVVVSAPTPIPAISAAVGSLPTWVPIATVGVIGLLIAASGDSDSDSTTGTTGTN